MLPCFAGINSVIVCPFRQSGPPAINSEITLISISINVSNNKSSRIVEISVFFDGKSKTLTNSWIINYIDSWQ